MQIAEEGSTTMAKKHRKLAMEDYIDFIDNRTLSLTASKLGQIVGMHGYKTRRIRKNLLLEMISTMDLMNLRRSTLLDDGVSGDACFTLKEVIQDLKDLHWQECHVTSILTQGTGVSASDSTDVGAVSVKRRKKKGLGMKAVEVGIGNSAVSAGTTVAAGSTTECLRSVDCDFSTAVSCPASPPISLKQTRRRLMKSKKV
ncbi:hypothetical protein OROHE_021365 [Orobanche hederae]